MKPILLIHGYASEGKNNSVQEIYGSLPEDLRTEFGDAIQELNLSRWISLNDGVALDDISFAMERALNSDTYKHLLETGFHVIIHSTGALVVRNWIRLFSSKPCPIDNLVYLAGANFGSGLAHIGQGQLARWGRLIFQQTGRGMKVLNELEFGSWKTLDLHLSFLKQGHSMYDDFQVQEFCLIGSQTLDLLRYVPIRYVKEDSSDNTVRTSASNLNYNYIKVFPKSTAYQLSTRELSKVVQSRLNNKLLNVDHYEYDLEFLSEGRREVPFAVIFETAHFGSDIGIVSGKDNRQDVMPLIKAALNTPYDSDKYQQAVQHFTQAHEDTFNRAKDLDSNIFEWNKQSQYEGHAQIIFRLIDQFGNAVENFDITFKSYKPGKKQFRVETMIEDKHVNKKDKGTITFYLRTQSFINGEWLDLLKNIADLHIEITGYEALSGDIAYLPINVRLNSDLVRKAIQSFRTTIIDVVLARLPSEKVF